MNRPHPAFSGLSLEFRASHRLVFQVCGSSACIKTKAAEFKNPPRRVAEATTPRYLALSVIDFPWDAVYL